MANSPQNLEIGWTPQDLYNMFMVEIEPELCTTELPYLEDIYSAESEEDRALRIKRYTIAFEMCEERMGKFFMLWKTQIMQIKRSVLNRQQSESAAEEQPHMQNVEDSINEA